MFTTKTISCLSNMSKNLSRNIFSLAHCPPSPVREVYVSQTRDLISNIALEDWAVRNIDLSERSLLILTNNITKSGVDIKATYLGPQLNLRSDGLEEIVISCLTPDLLLKSLPTTKIRVADDHMTSHSIQIELVPEEVKSKTVLKVLENIGKSFLADMDDQEECKGKINLVRPDGGWFPGLGEIREELEQRMSEIERLNRREQKMNKTNKTKNMVMADKLHNSFGL